LDVGKDNYLSIFKKQLTQNDITLDSYINYIMPLFKFRRNKNSQKIPIDTHSSDGEDDDDDDDDEEDDE
jgi:hypothetical protein